MKATRTKPLNRSRHHFFFACQNHASSAQTSIEHSSSFIAVLLIRTTQNGAFQYSLLQNRYINVDYRETDTVERKQDGYT